MFSLSNYGYSCILKEKERHNTLLKALKKEKMEHVIEKLKKASFFIKKTMPDISNIYISDIIWLKTHYGVK